MSRRLRRESFSGSPIQVFIDQWRVIPVDSDVFIVHSGCFHVAYGAVASEYTCSPDLKILPNVVSKISLESERA